MVIVKLISGLGNQLFQYAVGRELSLRNNTNLKVDTSFFGSQNLRSYKLDCFNINATTATLEEVNKLTRKYLNHSLKNRIERKGIKLLGWHQTYFAEKAWWLYDDELLKARDNTYLNGYWQHYRYFEQLNPIILSELTLKDAFLTNIQALCNQLIHSPSVSIHIRRGDYITDKKANNLMGVQPLSYYHQAIEIMRSRIADPHFLFFSDDITWVKKEFSDLQDSFFAEGFTDYEDLALMSNCRHHIIANSSFSWWGAFLKNNPQKIVIAPKHWVINPDINQTIEIQFPHWIKI